MAPVVAVSASSFLVSGTNIARSAGSLVIYTPASGALTPTNMYGAEVTVVGGRVTAVSDRLVTGAGATAIPASGVVLSGHDAARDWLLTYARVGTAIRLPGETTALPAPKPGALSVTFDDGLANQYTNAIPAMRRYGIPGTFYVIGGFIGTAGYMTANQVRDLHATGNEIGNHTLQHPRLDLLTKAEVKSQFTLGQQAISAASGVTPTTCAYPNGAYNSTVTEVAAQIFTACRTTTGGADAWASPSAYRLTVYNVSPATPPASVNAAIASAKADGRWLILVYHGVGTGEEVTTNDFSSVMQYAKASGIPLRTVSQGRTLMTG